MVTIQIKASTIYILATLISSSFSLLRFSFSSSPSSFSLQPSPESPQSPPPPVDSRPPPPPSRAPPPLWLYLVLVELRGGTQGRSLKDFLRKESDYRAMIGSSSASLSSCKMANASPFPSTAAGSTDVTLSITPQVDATQET
ncbi:uncharacterized protein LOC113312922 [Papaver somniferum]|uniref:uncharacterized protein LOC113312922 n=1 Tax=Papaver somniferum TaxID=3469 RepID=UPI000E6FFBF9|nr:uncharacterized protein LOC113312922 [Papaver somniferum]